MMTIAKVIPWVQPAPFRIDGSVLETSIRSALRDYCLENENMYDYTDGDFTAVFDLTKPLFLVDLTEGYPDQICIDYVASIKQHLPEDYNESTIGVYFCNG